MDDRAALAGILRREAVRHGDFVLASGKRSKVYVDVRLASLHPDALLRIGRVLLAAIDRLGDRQGFSPVAVGGMATGAIPLAAAVVLAAAEAGRPLSGFYVRKDARDHGRNRKVEGIENPSGDAVILEDTASTGGSLLAAADAARDAGFRVRGALALVDREMGAAERLQAAGVPFEAVYRLPELVAPG